MLYHEDCTILYVDSQPADVDFSTFLFGSTSNICTATSIEKGFKILEQRRIKIVICNQRIADNLGIEFLKRAKAEYPYIKYILLTSFFDSAILEEAINTIGVFGYLHAPFNNTALAQMIQRALDSYRIDKDRNILGKKIELILQTAHDAIITINEQHIIELINPAALELFGYQEEELLGKNLGILIPRDVPNHGALINKFGKTKKISRQMGPEKEVYGKTKSGNLIAIETNLSKIKQDGKVFYNAIIRDVTEKLLWLKKIEESEAEFKGLFNSMVDVFIRRDENDIAIMVSPSIERVTGYSQEDIIGKDISNLFVHPEKVEQNFEKLLNNPDFKATENEMYKKDGSIITISSHAKIYYDANGNRAGIESVFRDVTERNNKEKIIEESEAKFKGVFNSMSDVFIRRDKNNIITMISPSVKEVTGYSQEELMGKNLINFVIDAKSFLQTYDNLLKKGGPRITETKIVKKDGSTITVSSHVGLYYDDKGNALGVQSLTRDISAQKKAEKEIGYYQNNLKELAHELTLSEEQLRKKIAIELHDDIGQLLSSSRMQMSAIDYSGSVVEIEQQINEISKGLRRAIKSTRELIFELSPPQLNEIGLYAAVYDWMQEEISRKHHIKTYMNGTVDKFIVEENIRVLLFRSIKELLMNVVKHAKATHIEVLMETQGNDIIVKIRDDGIGFDLKEKTPKEREGSYGLFSIQERISNLGGTINVDSKLSFGSVVTLTVPIK